jgi:peptidoglycan/LPS O-acetylase OafA/YrhL
MPSSTVTQLPPPSRGRAVITPALSRALDVMRGIAALAVVVQHARTYLFADLRLLPPQPLAVRAVYFLTGFGHAAVMVFFVLSGFLVGGSALAAIEDGRFTWRRYLLQRGTRLWIVLLPALALTALWDRAGLLVVAHPQTLAAHAHTVAFGAHAWTVEGHGPMAFVGNAFFLMNVLVPTFGTNGSLWSLANEFWYYVLFPLAALAVIDRRDVRRAVVPVALFAAVAMLVGREILSWGSIWLMGAAVARAPRLRLSRRVAVALATVAALALAAVLVHDRLTANDVALARDVVVGALFSLVLYALRCIPERETADSIDDEATGRAPSRLAAPFLALAGFGYTLYLVHEPPLALLRVWIIAGPHHRWTPSVSHLAAAAAIVVAIVAYAYALARVTEARTDRVRAWAVRHLPSGPAPLGRRERSVEIATMSLEPSRVRRGRRSA